MTEGKHRMVRRLLGTLTLRLTPTLTLRLTLALALTLTLTLTSAAWLGFLYATKDGRIRFEP